MKSQDRMIFWYQHIEAQKLSRGSAVMYCAREKISVYSFYHWRRKFEAPKRPALPTVAPGFRKDVVRAEPEIFGGEFRVLSESASELFERVQGFGGR